MGSSLNGHSTILSIMFSTRSSRAIRHRLIVCMLSISMLTTHALVAQTPVTEARLQQLLTPLVDAHAGEVAVSVQVMDAANEVVARCSLRGEQVMPTASLIKLPVMIEAYRQAHVGSVSLDDLVTLTTEDQVPGSGILTDHFSPGLRLSLRDAIRLMIRYSDNTATNLVVDRIGVASTAKTMAEWGMPETQLHSKVFRRDTSVALERSEKYGLGSTTANDMTELLVRLERGQLISLEASQEMLAHLLTCDDTAKLPRDLPKDCQIAHKTGSVNRSRTAAGLVSGHGVKFAICVLTDKNEDTSWSDDNAAHVLIGRLTLAVYDELLLSMGAESRQTENNIAAASATGTLHIGAVGDLVESLQRTLNFRIDAGLGIDGDFGPATQDAVKSFQKASQLDVSGMVDAKTWQALGPLIEQDAPVPAPQVINSREFTRTAALNPLATPEVSAKAWAIMNVESGQLIGEARSGERLPMASTTKVMTALLVMELAMDDPQVMEEVVTFSTGADETIGSTSGVRAGEQLSVGELLYGLLLPSGNDAAVALAEHFGDRLVDTHTSIDAKPDNALAAGEQFVAAMNARAKALGMNDSHFMNANGLSDAEHYSSASDLARLTLAALRYPKLRQIVQCRGHGVQVRSVDGYTRNLLWENTNRLLSQDGFVGMKTGTTEAAGACLIAVGKLPTSSLGTTSETIVVVLGCSSSDARYIDARNLFSWAWRQTP